MVSKSFTTLLLRLSNRQFLFIDIVILLVTPTVALALRTDSMRIIAGQGSSLLVVTLVFLVAKLAILYLAGVYRRIWRYAGVQELVQINVAGVVAIVVQTVILLAVLQPLGLINPAFPRSVGVIDVLLALPPITMLRYSVRFAQRSGYHGGERDTAQRVVIMGAGEAGVLIADELRSNPELKRIPVAFLDDDERKHHQNVRGLPVLGNHGRIPEVVKQTNATEVIIALPRERGKVIRDIVQQCEQANVQTKIIPALHELVSGTARINQLREVRIEDLLLREPVHTDIAAVRSLIGGKRVLITGGGGSIGSELCRQVMACAPAELIVLGHGENSVFQIESELRTLLASMAVHQADDEQPACTLTTVVADIRFAERLHAVFREHRPHIVFHAAAHKHVPLMELNPSEAITNNVLGTRNLLHAARAVDVDHFVMISTDKAVNPSSVMGASKRVAEQLVHQAGKTSGKAYVAVRFGNVLGSRGSVVLTYQQQIAAGGPVTVTHPKMRRYFMTIPEAVQLVLQAAAVGHGGEVFVLNMGTPVYIVDLARHMIELSGLEVGKDIDIVFTGLRPGEKLFEELFAPGEEYQPTLHDKIFTAQNASSFVPTHLNEMVEALAAAAQRNDHGAIIAGLQQVVPQFRPMQPAEQAPPTEAPLKAMSVGG